MKIFTNFKNHWVKKICDFFDFISYKNRSLRILSLYNEPSLY